MNQKNYRPLWPDKNAHNQNENRKNHDPPTKDQPADKFEDKKIIENLKNKIQNKLQNKDIAKKAAQIISNWLNNPMKK
jgi:hypothetical protein